VIASDLEEPAESYTTAIADSHIQKSEASLLALNPKEKLAEQVEALVNEWNLTRKQVPICLTTSSAIATS
jgi:hypothetical protein